MWFGKISEEEKAGTLERKKTSSRENPQERNPDAHERSKNGCPEIGYGVCRREVIEERQ